MIFAVFPLGSFWGEFVSNRVIELTFVRIGRRNEMSIKVPPY